jgi:hypothetical protein
MGTFRRLLQISFFVALLAASTATSSAAAQDTAPPPDQQTAPPSDQAPPPPAAETAPPAQDQPAYPADQAPPSAGGPAPAAGGETADPSGRVARLGYMTGSVSIQPQGTGDWVQGSLNRPLTNADNVWADKDSRAELNLGTGVMRISSETSLTLTNVTNDAVQVQLHQGTLNLHIRKLYGGEVYEIDTPNQAFTVSRSGEYRFDVDPNADTTLVTVWKGEGEATGQGPAVRVHEGQQARFSGGTSLAHQISDAPRPDGFDDWCRVRDKREDNSVSARYVAPGVVGASDLDEYGTWRDDPQYGNVWVPTSVAPGWAPYSYGHWISVAPWGWTWVDDAPWGFAPFHYGRWVTFGGSWGWAPGPYWVRPWYAPALVAWFGGPGFGIGFGFGGGFGWCPLGFGEPFFPWYRGGRGYFRNVNISNTRITNINNITNNYYNHRNGGALYGRNGIGMPRYASKPGALTVASRNSLERGTPVAGSAGKISPSALRNLASASIGRPNVSPTRASVLGPKAGLPAAHPSAATASRPTLSRMTPPNRSSGPSPSIAGTHSTGAPMGRNPLTAAAPRGPEGRQSTAMSSPAPGGRYVPRPPQSLGNRNPAATSGRSGNPPAGSRSVPRPPEGSASRPTMSARNTVPNTSTAPHSYGSSSPGRSMSNPVPRPSGQVLPAPRNYPSAQSRGNYSARAYGGGGYGGYRGYSAPSYGGGYGGRSYSAPSYGGAHGGRSYSAPSYGGGYGGRSYSAPSSHSSGSFGGYHGSSGSHGSSGYHGSSGGHSGSGGQSGSHAGRGR